MTIYNVHSTWLETEYALALTRSTGWPAQRNVLIYFLFVSRAQGIDVGPICCSERDLASHMYPAGNVSVGSVGKLFDGLVRREVLRPVIHGANQGTAPSEWQVWHYTRWNVPWRVPREQAIDRIAASTVLERTSLNEIVRAPSYGRALAKMAKANSAAFEGLARAHRKARAAENLAPRSPWPEPREARAKSVPTTTHSLGNTEGGHVAEREEGGREEGERELADAEEEKREASGAGADVAGPLIDAFLRGADLGFLRGAPVVRLRAAAAAASANGSMARILEIAEDPAGPSRFLDRLALIEESAAATPLPASGTDPESKDHGSRTTGELERLRADVSDIPSDEALRRAAELRRQMGRR